MPAKQPLLRPMRSDELKPRPPAQAVWTPAPSCSEPVEEPVPAQPEKELLPVQPLSDAPVEDDAFGEILSSLLSEKESPLPKETPAKSKHSDKHDAVPNHLMPTPVCVPLYEFEEPAPPRKRSAWIWILPVCAALAAAAFAAWHFGLLPFNLA